MGEQAKVKLGATVTKDGVSFAVWAPFADSVAVCGSFNDWNRKSHFLTGSDSGVWSGQVDGAKVGQEYKYIIRTGEQVLERNDPRALQVTAAGDASVIVDPQFDWEGDDFKIPAPNDQVIYELHIGTFNRTDPATPGTFETATAKLDYLRELGINMIEVLPINGTNMERWWGYEPTYQYAVDAQYGGRQAFLEFVKAAHSHGMGVIVDVVYNHMSPEGLDLWQFDGWSQNGKGGIYFYNDWRGDTPWGPRLDYGRPEVRQFITDNVRMWLGDCHVDGIRVDAVFAIRNAHGRNDDPDGDLPDGWKLLQDINAAAAKVKPEAIMIGEDMALNNWITKPVSDGGAGFRAQWESSFPTKLRDVLVPANDSDRHLEELAHYIGRKYNNDGFQRIVFSESHDADANGHARTGEEIAPGDAGNLYARRRSAIGAAIALTAPGIPMLFQGQEFMESGWFTHWKALDWQKAHEYAGIVQFYSHLIALRRNRYNHTRGLQGQGFDIAKLHEDDKLLAYHRWDQGGPGDDVIIAINFSNKPLKDYKINFPGAGSWIVRLNSDWSGYSKDFTDVGSPQIEVTGSTGTISIGAYSVLILSQDK